MALLLSEGRFHEVLNVYSDRIKEIYSGFGSVKGNPEDQLKRPIRNLIESFNSELIQTHTETQIKSLGARPDIGVTSMDLLTGYIELKAPGIGANTRKFTKANRKQWKKFQALPNILYTDGNEWALYRNGERISPIIRYSGDVFNDGKDAISGSDATKIHKLLIDFLNWEPIVPSRPRSLAEVLAPICRFLRDDVEAAVNKDDSAIFLLYKDWKRLFFPEADFKRFADAYAQTLTYALLLARLNGIAELGLEEAAKSLESGHGLLAQTLRLLGHKSARNEISTAIDLLERILIAVDPEILKSDREPWLYFYEDFLAAYDPDLRRDFGVYYTPTEIINCQVRLCSRILEDKFGKNDSYADENVTFLDPAAGTAAYPLAAIQYGLEIIEEKYGEGFVPNKASEMAKNFYGFEYMVGPYAVGHLRLTKALKDAKASIPEEGIKLFLTNTLENPDSDPPRFAFAEREIAEEHKRAQEVKRDTRILVCMGNPPYDRQHQTDSEDTTGRRKGAWVRFGEDLENTTETEGILKDFIEGAEGVHVNNLYNDYVYFWRWALWKLFENENSSGPGVLSFITASSYLRGPGFTKMRRHFREVFDDIWIIDLEGDRLGARKTENVFAIQIPVAILIGVRYGEQDASTPANVRYTRFKGSREEKLSQLNSVYEFSDLEWAACFSGWEKPLLPESDGAFFDWPLITDLFPWQHSGSQFKRTWPIACNKEVLIKRWKKLIDSSNKADLFKETRDRKVENRTLSKSPNLSGGKAIAELTEDDPIPKIFPYGFRSFNRHYCLADVRVGDFLRPDLWNVLSENQVYMVSLLTEVMGLGPAATISSYVPDMHYFRGSFGGKNVIPLWRDPGRREPNVTNNLLKTLADEYAFDLNPEDLFAYAYSLLSIPDYNEKYSEELTIPGPRLPITKNIDLFKEASSMGKKLVWLHSFGERFVPERMSFGEIPQGEARCTQSITSSGKSYPNSYSYDQKENILSIGSGNIINVRSTVWNFSVSGLQIVASWLDYRMKDRYGRKSSRLDKVRPERWSTKMTKELLKLLWILEHTLDINDQLRNTFYEIIESNCFEESELPKPAENEKAPPKDSKNQYSLRFD